jgi:hypothetical protein
VEFIKATKRQAKLRAAVFGPSGSGKTYTALRVATGLGDKVGLIDTERCSASKYADRFPFDALDLQDRSIGGYCEAIRLADVCGYEVLIIDSLSHGWQQLLEEVDRTARAKYRGNTWAAWNEATPQQRRLVDAILSFSGHVICTMRSKTQWEAGGGDGKKTRPIRVGLAPEQRSGIEYEFDLLLELTTEHIATVIKDRTGRLQDRMIEKPGEELGKELAAWLSDGEAPSAPQAPPPPPLPPTVEDFLARAVRAHDATQLTAIYRDAEEAGVGSDGMRIVATACRERLDAIKATMAANRDPGQDG